TSARNEVDRVRRRARSGRREAKQGGDRDSQSDDVEKAHVLHYLFTWEVRRTVYGAARTRMSTLADGWPWPPPVACYRRNTAGLDNLNNYIYLSGAHIWLHLVEYLQFYAECRIRNVTDHRPMTSLKSAAGASRSTLRVAGALRDRILSGQYRP